MAETKETKKILELGNFYLIHDGSKRGHPGLIIWKNDEQNLYLAVKIGTSPNKKNHNLNELINHNGINHYVYKRPFLGKRKDFGSKPFKCFLSPKNYPFISKQLSSPFRLNQNQ